MSMSMIGELKYFLGLQITQLPHGIFIYQEKYTKELLKKYNMESTKAKDTTMASTCQLDKDDKGKSVNETTYRGIIGSLLYLTASRPDILFSTFLCAHFQSSPKESHVNAIKGIFRYLNGTSNLGLFYPSSSLLQLNGFCDADFAGSKTDGKSTSGTCHFIGDSLVAWSSKKQNCVALSITEAEYISAALACSQSIWMKNCFVDLGVMCKGCKLMCDNTSAINLAKNPITHSRSKHIDIKHHFLRDKVLQNEISLEYIRTEDQVADIFTKPLGTERFITLRRKL